jgi:hypothetical protein
LGTKYYENYFEIKKKGLNAVKSLLISWNIDNLDISNMYSFLGYESLKVTTKILSKDNNITQKQKKEYLNEILHDSETIKILNDLQLLSIKDKTICKLMQLKQSQILLYIYKRLY